MPVTSKPAGYGAGFTLVELLVAIASAGFVLVGLARLLTFTLDGYSLQVQMAEMHQNVHYAFRQLSEIVMQAGADLPDTASGIAVVVVQTAEDFSMMVNPAGGNQVFESVPGSVQSVPVGNPRHFVRADSVIIVFKDGSAPRSVGIDTGYSTGGFVRGIDTGAGLVRLVTPVGLSAGDQMCSFNRRRLYRDAASNELRHIVNTTEYLLVEGIDSMSVTFRDSAGGATTGWNSMKAAAVHVTARTPRPHRRYVHPVKGDGYRRASLDMVVRLRNRM